MSIPFSAQEGQIADIVYYQGDPLRAKSISPKNIF